MPTLWDKIRGVLYSRKFWFGLVIPIVTAAGGLATGALSFPQFLNAVLIAAAAYTVSTGVEDGLSRK